MTIVGAFPSQLQNGTTADATEVMADLNKIRNDVNSNAAANGANSDITSLSGLTTPLSVAQGGTNIFTGGTSTGSANAHAVASTSPNSFTLTAGAIVTFIAGFTNTTAATLNTKSTGVKNVYKPTTAGPVVLTGGEIVVGNEVIVIYDGTQYQLIGSAALGSVNYQAFTGSGTWTKPLNVNANSTVLVQAWGAGGGGGENASGGGGGGGTYVEWRFLASALGATETVTIGAGGAVHLVGGNTTFGSWLTAYGGGGGANTANGGGGGGGGQASVGGTSSTTAGSPGANPAPRISASTLFGDGGAAGATGVDGLGNVSGGGGGGGGGTSGNAGSGGACAFGGGGGGGGGTSNGGGGGLSVYGGGGGGGKAQTGGASTFGGTGGTGGSTAPTAPGGGGGRNTAGARGEVRVTTFI